MKIKVSDYIAKFLIEKGITDIFTVVGGGAMHMNDSFGHNSQLHCLYNHHEQASAMAGEAYARLKNKMAAVCVTSGPGAINALNGVAGAYQDSIPMLIFSGQTKTTLTVKYSGLNLRTLGNQEFDIVSALDNMTKYAEMIMDPKKIRCCLEKAYYVATTGRPGPCWLDIPLDVQGSYVEEDELIGYNIQNNDKQQMLFEKNITKIIEKLQDAKRPVLYAGTGVRLSGGVDLLHKLAEKFSIPVVTCWDSIDLMSTDDRLYCGRGGTMGDRAGNFAVQNSDLLICIGTRLNIYQVGYNVDTWARAAYTIVVDIDSEELKKKTVRIDLPVCTDARQFMQALLKRDVKRSNADAWVNQCNEWKQNYPVVSENQKNEHGLVNVYAFIDILSHMLPNKAVTVVSNGSCSVVGSQSYYIKDNDRFLINCGISSMGYGLPAAIGACVANNKQMVVCLEGDGSLMMNLQELQTVVTNKLPIKLFVINNAGYHQIRQTQNNIFHNGLVGVGPESHDLDFPDYQKLALAFGLSYVAIKDNLKQKEKIKECLESDGAVLCEVFVSTEQKFEPKSATKKLEDGSLFSPPLEDLAPFLSREELKRNMYIPLIDEK
ncbi:thiamine pyrophosphate-binding protein [uncultured Phascolarctobacterium sp.]|uniref:thiamine pyrophosphate-binding protein n=1 Tax=uncultured Phascolarctobacterium sp. TaxID=512296 RepID=UPI0025DDE3E7|nr:thiamine pyrophosphate-binding protein [uncultured Phascolarctobacterium sp.]